MGKNKAKIATISERTWQGSQSWNHEQILAVGAERVRLTVKSDAYDMQSYAKAEVWKDKAWSTVHHIPGQQLATRASYVARGVTADRFAADVAELRRVAFAVLGLAVAS